MKILYLHGFASGPASTKGVAFEKYFAERDIAIKRVNLRVPSFEQLRLSAMIETVLAELHDRTILIGSSLGGLVAARVAERDSRVVGLILLAPAFKLVERWRETLGPEWELWRKRGWREVTDYTTGHPARVDWGFIEDALLIDNGYPNIRVPTLILHGLNDDVVPFESSRAFAIGKDWIDLVELEDGHELVASLDTLLDESEAFLAAQGA
jgi:pimeloyl-ACP methyl ester carboxylesterase